MSCCLRIKTSKVRN